MKKTIYEASKAITEQMLKTREGRPSLSRIKLVRYLHDLDKIPDTDPHSQFCTMYKG